MMPSAPCFFSPERIMTEYAGGTMLWSAEGIRHPSWRTGAVPAGLGRQTHQSWLRCARSSCASLDSGIAAQAKACGSGDAAGELRRRPGTAGTGVASSATTEHGLMCCARVETMTSEIWTHGR